MIDSTDMASIDKDHFIIIEIKEYTIVIKSRSTGHYWCLLEQVYNGCRTFRISHKHHAADPYHFQRNKPSIANCCEFIQSHDAYQLAKEHGKEVRRARRQEEKRKKRALPG